MLKVRAFAWKLLSNAVAVRERLMRRGVQVPIGCPVCGNPETVLHLFAECRWLAGIWENLLGLPASSHGGTTVMEWMTSRLSEPARAGESNSTRWTIALITCWTI